MYTSLRCPKATVDTEAKPAYNPLPKGTPAAATTITMVNIWLGGLDSNQDSQLQRLMYCRLYDLPAEGDYAWA